MGCIVADPYRKEFDLINRELTAWECPKLSIEEEYILTGPFFMYPEEQFNFASIAEVLAWQRTSKEEYMHLPLHQRDPRLYSTPPEPGYFFSKAPPSYITVSTQHGLPLSST